MVRSDARFNSVEERVSGTRIRTARITMLASPTPEAAEGYAQLRSEIVPMLRELGPESIALDTLLMLAMDDGDPQEAGRLLALVPDEAANDPGFWRYRGWYAMRIGDLEQADQAYRQALELHLWDVNPGTNMPTCCECWDVLMRLWSSSRLLDGIGTDCRYQSTASCARRQLCAA